MTGWTPQSLNAPETRSSIPQSALEFLMSAEDLLLIFAANTGLEPADIASAHHALERANARAGATKISGRMARRERIGIDLGGTKIAGILLTDDGRIAAESRLDTPRNDYDKIVEAIAALVDQLAARAQGTVSVGIGIPGSISPATGRVQNANSTWLNGRPLDVDVEAALKQPVRIANDANCFALSEATDGAGAGAASVFGVILGTGCGGRPGD